MSSFAAKKSGQSFFNQFLIARAAMVCGMHGAPGTKMLFPRLRRKFNAASPNFFHFSIA
jgi:hypothetical protein